jgi:hypothetical protein
MQPLHTSQIYIHLFRLEDFQKYMHKFANPPAGKTPAYFVVLRPKTLSPKQIDIMHEVALIMMEQNQT